VKDIMIESFILRLVVHPWLFMGERGWKFRVWFGVWRNRM